SQSVGIDTKTGDATVSPNVPSGDQNQNATQQGSNSSAQGQTANPDDKERKGKGYAKGHERGKGHGVNDERHGGRHSSGDNASSGASAQPENAQDKEKKY
ncbi:MAG TPA: hypothetical protein VM756_17860, partial [Burkholderiales bacterium]|nr:hypothetical protein [Burkholderiales bacterium]